MNRNKKIIRVLIIVSFMFLSLVTYLLYFNMFRATEVATNTYNKRQWDDEKHVKRGSIYDCNGVVLAETEINGEKRVRKYPRGHLYSHVIGYYSQVYGKSLLEMQYDKELLGQGDISINFSELRPGYDLHLTIDDSLQGYAYDCLGKRKGAVVAIEPTTGKVLAMVSYPDFDPSAEALEKSWNYIVERDDAPLLSRATNGLYPPGSTYKIATAAAAYNAGYSDDTFEDTGAFKLNGLKVDNYGGKSYGTIDLRKAFTVSSNAVFCEIGYELGAENVLATAESFGVNKDINTDMPVSKSRIEYKKMSNADGALVSIGQGQLLMTPLQVAMMGAAVANDGIVMKPHIVDSVTTASGMVYSTARQEAIFKPMDAVTASYVKDLMIDVVKSGTGTSAAISGITVAGKTGTAEAEGSKDHSWFVGFAPAENPQIVVAVILENDGQAGGTTAAPIARNVMKRYLQ